MNRLPHDPSRGSLTRSAGIVVVAAAALLLSVVARPAPTFARTWRVEKDDSGDFTTIQPAVDAAARGDTVLIGPGRYLEYAPYDFGARTELTYVVVNKPNLTIRGTDRDAVVIGPEAPDWPNAFEPNGISTTSGGPGTLIEALTIENVAEGVVILGSGTIRGSKLVACRTGVTVLEAEAPSVISTTTFLQCLEFGAFCAESPAITVTDCRFDGSFLGILISQIPSTLIERCTLLNEAFIKFQFGAAGIIRGSTLDSAAIVILDSSATIEDNYVGHTTRNCLDVSGGTVTATRNVFAGGEDATILLRNHADVVMTGNHILNAGEGTSFDPPSVRAMNYVVLGHTLDLRNNWWGSPYGSDIRRWIYDGVDDDDVLATVQYFPFAEGPVAAKNQSFGSLKTGFGQ